MYLLTWVTVLFMVLFEAGALPRFPRKVAFASRSTMLLSIR